MRRYVGWAIAVVALAGCGGSDDPPEPTGSDREQVETVVMRYLEGLLDGDGDAACDQLTPAAQDQFATISGSDSCTDGVEKFGQLVEDDLGGGDPRVVNVTIRGAKAEARVAAGDKPTQTPALLEKAEGTWRISGFPPGVDFRSRAEAECILGGMGEFDRGESDQFWQREGREDFRDYIVGVCRGADRQGLLDESGNEPEIQRIAGQVVLRMIRSGQIRDPRVD
jgi:hypothetical protein